MKLPEKGHNSIRNEVPWDYLKNENNGSAVILLVKEKKNTINVSTLEMFRLNKNKII